MSVAFPPPPAWYIADRHELIDGGGIHGEGHGVRFGIHELLQRRGDSAVDLLAAPYQQNSRLGAKARRITSPATLAGDWICRGKPET